VRILQVGGRHLVASMAGGEGEGGWGFPVAFGLPTVENFKGTSKEFEGAALCISLCTAWLVQLLKVTIG
jgi:hypothetical protein